MTLLQRLAEAARSVVSNPVTLEREARPISGVSQYDLQRLRKVLAEVDADSADEPECNKFATLHPIDLRCPHCGFGSSSVSGEFPVRKDRMILGCPRCLRKLIYPVTVNAGIISISGDPIA